MQFIKYPSLLRGSIPLLGVAKRLHFRATSRGANPFFFDFFTDKQGG